MTDLLRLAVFVFVVIDPVGIATAGSELGAGRAPRARAWILAGGALTGIAVLGAAALLAEPVLRALDVSVPAAQLAAGIVLLVPTLELLFGGAAGRVVAAPAASALRLGLFPFGVPVVAAPAAVAAVLAFAAADGGGTALGAVAIAVTAAVALAAARTGHADPRATRVLAAFAGAAVALVAFDLVRDGVFGT